MEDLRSLVAEELGLQVEPQVEAIASAIAAKHGTSSRAVLFYGSCLREGQLAGRMLDFYLIVSDYRAAYRNYWLAIANRLLPPNVFYFEHGGLIAKYAVLSEGDFHRLNGPETSNVSVWARFAQPSRLAWAPDAKARERAVDAIVRAAPTLLAAARPAPGEESLALWRRAFELTYSAELRAERAVRASSLIDLEPERYQRFTAPALVIARSIDPKGSWPRKRIEGKVLSVLRLAKAAFTFSGGADYIAWKINRHARMGIKLRPWQRRHPLLGGISLLPRLLRSGAIR